MYAETAPTEWRLQKPRRKQRNDEMAADQWSLHTLSPYQPKSQTGCHGSSKVTTVSALTTAESSRPRQAMTQRVLDARWRAREQATTQTLVLTHNLSVVPQVSYRTLGSLPYYRARVAYLGQGESSTTVHVVPYQFPRYCLRTRTLIFMIVVLPDTLLLGP